MPSTVKVDRERRTIYITFFGEVTVRDLLFSLQEVKANRDIAADYAQIADFSDASSIMVNPEEVRNMASFESPFLPDAPRVIIAPSDEAFGMARMYQLLGDSQRLNLAVVRSRREAYAVLGLKD